MTYEYYDFLTTILRGIEYELDQVMWNKIQEDYPSPFSNTGNTYKNDTFEVKAYNWGDGGNDWNFKWRDVTISWYKYLGRGMCMNREMSLKEIYQMYQECVNSIMRDENGRE